jgi:dinuclear metal center YbgI/SA1388 family protein
MTSTIEVAAYLDQLLETSSIPDYGNALNGLQLENNGSISRVAASVDFSSRTVNLAIEQKADFLVLHHGMFWSGLKPLTGNAYTRMRALIENNVAVYSSHLPLDRHADFGNNVLLSKELELKPSGEFASYKGTAIGLTGSSDVPTSVLVERSMTFARKHGGDAVATGFPEGRQTRRWAMCTGAGASAESLEEAYAMGVDTLIVGEGPHHTAVQADELGIVVIYAGHYATETLGVAALAKHLAEKFGLTWTTIHAPTGL